MISVPLRFKGFYVLTEAAFVKDGSVEKFLMWYKCRACQYEDARGVIPGVSCGVYLFSLMAFPSLLIGFALGGLKKYLDIDGFGWWWLVIVPIAFVLALVSIIPTAYALELMEWIAYCWKRCPKCGKRKWSWGYRKGFGL